LIHALRGQTNKPETILQCAEGDCWSAWFVCRSRGCRNNCFLGNMPLLFTQVEYAKAVIALTEAEQRAQRASSR
jgi:hypothetical protein